ncbi:MAG: aminodeoxychorismate synthase component I [Chlorobium sp.]
MPLSSVERIAATLSRNGSLWFESAFCKAHGGGALLFSEPVEVLMLSSLSGIESFFRTLEEKREQGFFLAGWLSYEAGYGFEPALLNGYVNKGDLPLGWFGLYHEPERFSASEVEQLFSQAARCDGGVAAFNLSESEYAAKIAAIKEQIGAGNVYQVNFTGRYHFTFNGSAPDLFSALRGAQPSSYTALLNCGTRTILSFSPELFFAKRGSLIATMPMKGTAPRGESIDEDRVLKEALGQCPKNLAENLMIVDLLRNDLGRICKPGSVVTESLFATETWPTLHQMLSTIRGEQREDVGLYELFRALYPCGSITGAPKVSAMKLIQSLESEPRGIYTGAIGYIEPRSNMLFSVAIRTVELSGNKGVYGSGGGIVWDSDPLEEYRECQLKAKILAAAETHKVDLFETILWHGSYLWLEEHLERLAGSALALCFPCDTLVARGMLEGLEEELRQSSGNRFKVKLSLSHSGLFSLSYDPIVASGSGALLRLLLSKHRVDASQPLLYHKTTARELYNQSYASACEQGYDEVIFLNERGEVTEGAISTIFIRKGRYFYTPPLHCGLLNGIFRRYFLATRPWATEKVLTVQELREADMVYVANSARGLRAGFLMVSQEL